MLGLRSIFLFNFFTCILQLTAFLRPLTMRWKKKRRKRSNWRRRNFCHGCTVGRTVTRGVLRGPRRPKNRQNVILTEEEKLDSQRKELTKSLEDLKVHHINARIANPVIGLIFIYSSENSFAESILWQGFFNCYLGWHCYCNMDTFNTQDSFQPDITDQDVKNHLDTLVKLMSQ